MTLAPLPAGWSRAHLSHLAALPITNGLGEAAQDGDEHWPRYIRTTDIRSLFSLDPAKRVTLPPEVANEALLVPGDLLMTAAGSLGTSHLYTSQEPSCYAGYLVRFRADESKCEPRYVAWWTQSRDHLDQIAVGAVRSTIDNFSAGKFRSMSVPVPPLPVQRAISDFLDRETAEIDRVIAKQEELVGLLGERRSAVIAHAVTKGLNPQAPMKDSGFEWLGEVPGHWRVVPLKRVLDRVDQGVSPQAWAELAEDGGWGVLKSGCMNWGKFRETEHKALDPDFDIDPTIVVAEGDFVVSRASGSPNLVGSAAIVRSLNYKLILSDKTFRLVFAEGQESGYYYWVMNSTAYREQVKLAISGADGLANNLPLSSLRRIVIPLPPSSEQAAIAHHLNGVVGAIDTVMTKANESIALMRERRAALISDAVTGRLDIESYGRGRSEEGVA